MAVAREWRGRGVGLELLAAAIEWARERGLHKLSLGAFAHNASAMARPHRTATKERAEEVGRVTWSGANWVLTRAPESTRKHARTLARPTRQKGCKTEETRQCSRRVSVSPAGSTSWGSLVRAQYRPLRREIRPATRAIMISRRSRFDPLP